MDQNTLSDADSLLEQTVAIVTAYVANNRVPAAGLADLVALVHSALTNLGKVAAQPQRQDLQPAVSVKKSVTSAYLISLEDGRRYKMLKRHLSGLGMTPDQYRQKWNLARDYPMTAPDYAEKRSQAAKAAGLGRKTAVTDSQPKPRTRGPGRPKKSLRS